MNGAIAVIGIVIFVVMMTLMTKRYGMGGMLLWLILFLIGALVPATFFDTTQGSQSIPITIGLLIWSLVSVFLTGRIVPIVARSVKIKSTGSNIANKQ